MGGGLQRGRTLCHPNYDNELGAIVKLHTNTENQSNRSTQYWHIEKLLFQHSFGMHEKSGHVHTKYGN